MAEFKVCACLGPIKGEPLCPCQMISSGQRVSKDYDATDEEKEELRKVLERYGWK